MKKWLPISLILWLAFGLRVYDLTAVPPGLTHDEANHGREAIGVLDGIFLYYFPLNYGSEPLYSYTVAGGMGLLGENLFALRYINVVFGLLAIAATYIWAKRAFDERVGWITAVLLATSFWPLASSRQALRAGMLPFFMALAVWAFWQMVEGQKSRRVGEQRSGGAREQESPTPRTLHLTYYVLRITLFALLIAITFHIYLAARVVWLLFPAFVIYLAIVNRAKFRQVWWPTLLALLLAALLVAPMFVYLQNHPEAQTRLGMFRDPLGQIVSGDIVPMLQRAGKALLAFFWPGFGDRFLAYNIPGRPVFDLMTGLFFLIGLFVTVRFTIYDLQGRSRNEATFMGARPPFHISHTFLLLWFLIGIIPSLITGPTANTTRNLAALSAVHILPAIGFVTIADRMKMRWLVWGGPAVWLIFVLFTSSRDYFVRWAQSPDVRGAYQHTLIKELAYLRENPTDTAVILSTIYPGPVHDASIAMLLAPAKNARWFDARFGLIVPDGRSPQPIIPQSTPPHPLFTPWLQAIDTVTLRPDDLDPQFTVYKLDSSQLQSWLNQTNTAINFNGAITLRQAQWLADSTRAGGVAELLTTWQVTDPTRIGPRVPPTDATDTKMFTHVVDADHNIIAQQDLLSVPSWQWQTGDIILQVHQIWIAPEIEAGEYETAVGLYSEATGERVPIVGVADDRAFVTSLQIRP